jgi:hypothetical protein
MHEHPNPKLLHILNKMENSPSGKAAAAASLKAFATVTHAVALQNRSNLKATFNSNHDRCKKKEEIVIMTCYRFAHLTRGKLMLAKAKTNDSVSTKFRQSTRQVQIHASYLITHVIYTMKHQSFHMLPHDDKHTNSEQQEHALVTTEGYLVEHKATSITTTLVTTTRCTLR